MCNPQHVNYAQDLQELDQPIKTQLVSRPNIRLLSPPWFIEYKTELSLKNYNKIQLPIMLPSRKFGKNGGYFNNEQEESKINKILVKTPEANNLDKGYLGNCIVYVNILGSRVYCIHKVIHMSYLANLEKKTLRRYPQFLLRGYSILAIEN